MKIFKGRNTMEHKARPTTTLCCILFLVISSSLCVLGEDEEVIKDRSPVYERGFRQVRVGPKARSQRLVRVQPGAYQDSRAPLAAQDVQQLDPTGRPKSYAFAYAVKDGEYGDDFSHKERREGKVTVGEYSVLLPDGRTQVVRYTSDAKEGFKADVTYEGGKGHLSQPQTQSQQASPSPKPVRYQQAGSVASASQLTSPYQDNNNIVYQGSFGPTVSSYKSASLPRGPPPPSPSRIPSNSDGPIYLSYPLKSQQPSLSPSLLYKSTHGSLRQNRNFVQATPSTVIYSQNSGGSPSKSRFGPSPTPYPRSSSYPGPSQAPYQGPSQASYPGPSQASYQGPSHASYQGPSQASYQGPSQSSYQGPSQASYPGPSQATYSVGPSSSSYRLVGPSPTPYSRGPILIKASKLSASPGPYRSITPLSSPKYYPSPSPNSLYVRDVPVAQKYSASIQEAPKQVASPYYANTESAPPTAVASPYRSIMRGQRAGPDPTVGIIKHSAPAPPSASQFSRRGPSAAPYYSEPSIEYRNADDESYVKSKFNHKTLVPVNRFKAGPENAPLLEEQSVRQIYRPAVSTISTPLASPSPQSYFDSGNSISTSNRFAVTPRTRKVAYEQTLVPVNQNQGIYLEQIQNHKVRISPVKSSVATYTTQYLGVTPRPDLYQSTSSPGIPVGRPVQPSVGGLSYVDSPLREPSPNKLGVKEALSRLPSVSLPKTRTYEVGAPDFGSSVGYTNPDEPRKGNDRPIYVKDVSNNQLNLHDGILREYLVEKKIDVTPSYEEELV